MDGPFSTVHFSCPFVSNFRHLWNLLPPECSTTFLSGHRCWYLWVVCENRTSESCNQM